MCAEWDGKHEYLVFCTGLGSGRALWGWVDPIGAHSSLQLCVDYQECCLTTDLANKVFANPGIDSGKQQTPSPRLWL